MHYLTALCLLLSGIALSAHVMHMHRGVTVFSGCLVGIIGILLSIEYAFHLDLGFGRVLSLFPSIPLIPPIRPSPPTSACFAFCGVALVFLGSRKTSLTVRRLAVWILGSLILALCAMVLCGYATGLTGTYVWGNAVGMAKHTAIGMAILSVGLLFTQAAGLPRLSEDRWLPVPVALGVAVATLILWQALLAERHRAEHDEASLVAQNLASNSLVRVNEPFRALQRMKRRIERRGGMTHEEWATDASTYLGEEKVFDAIGRVDATGKISWLAPEDSPLLTGLDLRNMRRWANSAEELDRAQKSRVMVMSPPLDWPGGQKGYYACLPVYPGGNFDGFIVAGFRVGSFVSAAVKDRSFDRYNVSVSEDSELLFGDSPVKAGENSARAEATADFHRHIWRFTVQPQGGALSRNRLSTFVLMLGLPLAVAMAFVVRSFQQSVINGRAIHLANRRLHREIEERETAQSELRETLSSAEAAHGLLEAAGRIARLGHWEVTLNPRRLFWSEQMYAIHELAPGTPLTIEQAMAYLPPEQGEALGSAVRDAAQRGDSFEFEAELITAKKRRVWVHMRGEAQVGPDGQIRSIRGVMQDVDERRRAAELLERKNRELREATVRAEENARAKSEFLANMSHEIRTPLNAIIGMADLLLESRFEPREHEFVETIHSSGDLLLGLINDILDFSKIESGQLILEEIPMDLRECVESALDLVAGPASKKHLDLMYWMDPSIPSAIYGDPTRLRQVLVNLLSNAIKFTREGEVFVQLSLIRDAAGAPILHLAVRDSGIGIPEDRLDRLFQAFSQVDSSTTRRYGGTGLGLAISQRLIESMSGRMWVESVVDEGSTFHVEMPLRPAEEPPAAPVTIQRPIAGTRVLIVDDNATNRWILQMQTEAWSMTPVTVENAFQAMQLITAGERFDLAILDVMMPHVDGFDLAAHIRQHRSPVEMPILMLTSMGEPRVNFKELGISAVLTKPLKNGPLLRAIQSALQIEAAPAVSEHPPTTSKPSTSVGEEFPLKILIAEDNPVNQRVASLLLQRMGYRATAVANGLEVLEAVARTPLDVILLDIQMPEMDGLEAARQLCLRYPDPEARPWMIALTAHAVAGDREQCLEAGMDDYLTKPIRSDSLQAALKQAFMKKAPHASELAGA